MENEIDPGQGAQTLRVEKRKKRAKLNREILSNEMLPPKHKKGVAELADYLGVPEQHVKDQRNRLRKRGLLAPVKRHNVVVQPEPGEPAVQATIENLDSFDPEAMMKKVNSGEVVSREERQQILSLIIAYGADQYKISAIKALEEIEQATRKGIGPPEPITDNQRAERLSRLLAACGKEVAEKAWEKAFGTETSETGEEAASGTRSEGPSDGGSGVAGRSNAGEFRGEPDGREVGAGDQRDNRVSGAEIELRDDSGDGSQPGRGLNSMDVLDSNEVGATNDVSTADSGEGNTE